MYSHLTFIVSWLAAWEVSVAVITHRQRDGLSALMLRIAAQICRFQSLSSALIKIVELVFRQGNQWSSKEDSPCSSTVLVNLRPTVRSSLPSTFFWTKTFNSMRWSLKLIDIFVCDCNLRDCLLIPVSKFGVLRASRCGPFLRSYSPSSRPSCQRYRSNTTSQITPVDRILLRRNSFGFLVR